MTTKTESRIDALQRGEFPQGLVRNAPPARLYEEAILYDNGTITRTGGLSSRSGEKTGRSPKDKRVVKQASIENDVWWGEINVGLSEDSYEKVRESAIEFLDHCDQFYVLDAYAGWDPETRLKIRVVCSRAYHALFMHNMLIRPSAEELADFGEPDYVIYNAGRQKADPSIEGVESDTCVALNFDRGEMVILGTEYAGEMKKGVFTIMNYLMPKRGILSMHCSCNVGDEHDVSLFFGLSGTGKTTLSADPARHLVGDDEHCWNDNGVFNIEGGCYAKTINLTHETEPEIYDLCHTFGSIIENVKMDSHSRELDFFDTSHSENGRVSYDIAEVPNASETSRAGHPRNIIMLTCDAFGVLPPISKLSPDQAMYHFLSGYTAKVAGTERGLTEPTATFSTCFGAPFMPRHPTVYANLLGERMAEHGSNCWLVNTGWSGGGYGVGKRMKIAYTRAMVNAALDGRLNSAAFTPDPNFGVLVPDSCPDVPYEVLAPRNTWADKDAYDAQARKLTKLFEENFRKFSDSVNADVNAAAIRAAA